ncbi:alpha/beta hydrolase [Ammoniphilus sp. YIM 78166]|uniref:alpha/beta hydrolase n=1 Tax=Ammoniphilus sp. YIM 78166 TaxID=1644106 RepID=UPI00107049E1|nr:alpha/beta hydrolase [Ammoniphilus sp. YIM 78166]
MEMEQKLDPELRVFFSVLPTKNFADVTARRHLLLEECKAKKSPPNPNVFISERYIQGGEGAPNIRVKMYEPMDKSGLLPGLLWIHGGGYFLGAPEMDDDLCQRFAEEAHCVVLSVDYRLAPEHPFPAGLEDCYASLTWLFQHAAEVGVDPSRLAIAGASAGGGLCAALALLARDCKGPSLRFQMPLYPMMDDRNVTPSSYEITDTRIWNREANLLGWEMYLGTRDGTEISAYAAPARATDLSGLPPTYTCVGSADLFRDETIDYVMKLSQAGVPTEFHLYPGGYHGFEVVCPQAEISQRATRQYVDALKRAFQK